LSIIATTIADVGQAASELSGQSGALSGEIASFVSAMRAASVSEVSAFFFEKKKQKTFVCFERVVADFVTKSTNLKPLIHTD
jgi:uncharacterized protein YoxC